MTDLKDGTSDFHAVRLGVSRHPRLSSFLVSVKQTTDLPAILEFAFHSPFAHLRIDTREGDGEPLARVIGHELCHLAQQLRRYRRRARIGIMDDLHIGGAETRDVAWSDVDASLHLDSDFLDIIGSTNRLREDERAILVSHVGPCLRCGARPATLRWVYFVSPALTWLQMCGMAGWMAICERCPDQVAFFADRLN